MYDKDFIILARGVEVSVALENYSSVFAIILIVYDELCSDIS